MRLHLHRGPLQQWMAPISTWLVIWSSPRIVVLPALHLVSNAMGADTITTCIDYVVYGAELCILDTPTCCVTQAWDEESQTWQIAETASGIQVEPVRDVVLYPVPTSGQLNIRGWKLCDRCVRSVGTDRWASPWWMFPAWRQGMSKSHRLQGAGRRRFRWRTQCRITACTPQDGCP